jgi:hypothetical protein
MTAKLFRGNYTLHAFPCFLKQVTQQVNVAVMLYACVQEALDPNGDPDTGYPDYVNGFPQFLLEDVELVLQLGYDRYLPNPFQFINDTTIQRSIL